MTWAAWIALARTLLPFAAGAGGHLHRWTAAPDGVSKAERSPDFPHDLPLPIRTWQ